MSILKTQFVSFSANFTADAERRLLKLLLQLPALIQPLVHTASTGWFVKCTPKPSHFTILQRYQVANDLRKTLFHFHTQRYSSVTATLNIPPHLQCVVSLPCESVKLKLIFRDALLQFYCRVAVQKISQKMCLGV